LTPTLQSAELERVVGLFLYRSFGIFFRIPKLIRLGIAPNANGGPVELISRAPARPRSWDGRRRYWYGYLLWRIHRHIFG
jgi:hypothetical protein